MSLAAEGQTAPATARDASAARQVGTLSRARPIRIAAAPSFRRRT